MTAALDPRRPLRLIQVGMGTWGRDWMSVTAATAGVEPVAWVDPSPVARAATVALGAVERHVYTDLARALREAGGDAVLVTTDVAAHELVAVAALSAGLPVLVEKPLAPSLGGAAAVVHAAAAVGRTLMVSQNYRHHPAPRVAASLVQSGRIGDVVGVEVDFRRRGIGRQVRARHRAMTHPLLVDMAIHHFDLLRMVLGREPVRVEIEPIHPPSSEYRDPPGAYGLLRFEGGTVVSYRGNWVSGGRRTPWGGEWRVEGTDGSLEWRSRGEPGVSDALRLRAGGGPSRPLALPEVPALDREGTLVAFARSVRDGVEPETSGRRNLPTLALTLAAVRSATERRPVDVAELLAELPEDLR